jgi:putative salt-induced outer membrane protein YdiY
MKTRLILILFLSFIYHPIASAEEIYLKNKDRVTGEIIEESDESVSINTEAMGVISVKKDMIERIVRAKAEEIPQEKEVLKEAAWEGSISAGYNVTRGNTEGDQLSASFSLRKNRMYIDEIIFKGDAFYSAANKETDAQKLHGLARYAFSFGENKKWYNFYKVEADHDRFANIDYRLIPAAGVGYWFFDLPETKMMAEIAIGLEHTDYRDEREFNNEAVLIPRAFLERGLFVNSKLTQDVTLYPSLKDVGEFRLHSETTFTNPITDKLSLNFSLINDYDSDPPDDTRSHDLRLISSLAYGF